MYKNNSPYCGAAETPIDPVALQEENDALRKKLECLKQEFDKMMCVKSDNDHLRQITHEKDRELSHCKAQLEMVYLIFGRPYERN